MARQRSPDSIKAEKEYIKTNGEVKLKDLAKKYNVSPGTVRSWKNRYNWDDKISNDNNATLQKEKKNNKRNVAKKKKVEKPKHIEVAEGLKVESDELTEKQRLFCLYYVKSFNQTMSAIKAGYEPSRAHVTGSELVRNSKVIAEIRRLKGAMTNELFIDAMDVLKKYIAIAFADITDYVTFGRKEIQVMGAFGPLEDDKGNPVMTEVNYVDFKDSNTVDGTIIKEAKQGRDGVSIKLADKMKALEKLEQYFDLIPDKFKRKIQEEKLKIQKDKLELEKSKVDKGKNDGPIEIMIKRKGEDN